MRVMCYTLLRSVDTLEYYKVLIICDILNLEVWIHKDIFKCLDCVCTYKCGCMGLMCYT